MIKISRKALFLANAILLPSTLLISSPLSAKPAPSPSLQGWNFTAGAIDQQFSNSGTIFASNAHSDFNINNKYHGGYNLGIGYITPEQGSDINLDYTHLRGTDSSNVSSSQGLSLSGNGAIIGFITSAFGKNTYNFDSANLTAGHTINLSPSFSVNYLGGLNYTKLSRDLSTLGTGGVNDYRVNSGTNFSGVGPTIGLNGTCHPFGNSYPQFGFVTGINTAFPYGTLSGYLYNFTNQTLDAEMIPDTKTVIPVIGAKLAVNYNHLFNIMNLNTELGYQTYTLFEVTKDSTYTGGSINTSIQGFYLNFTGSF